MNPTDAANLVAELLETWPRAEVSPRLAANYAEDLSDYPLEVARQVVRRMRRTSKWLPTIAELLDALEAITHPEGDADEQWGVVCEAIRRVGVYQPAPRFADAVTAHCVRALGWRHLCKSPNDAADRKAFRDMYRAVAERDRRERRFGQPRTLEQPRRVAGFMGIAGRHGDSAAVSGTHPGEGSRGAPQGLTEALSAIGGGGRR